MMRPGSMNGNVTPSVLEALATEIETAREVLAASTMSHASLTVSGWGLGPNNNRSFFDGAVHPSVDVAALDPNVGWDPADPAFARVRRHRTTEIVWLEDDPGLSVPQLWVNRTLTHANEAVSYGVTGVHGLLWRTAETGPQLAALQAATWGVGSDLDSARRAAPPTDVDVMVAYVTFILHKKVFDCYFKSVSSPIVDLNHCHGIVRHRYQPQVRRGPVWPDGLTRDCERVALC